MKATKNPLNCYVALLLLASVFLSCTPAFAHPMGNFSVNHYAKIKLQQGSVEILYLIDLAEIPTYQEMREFSMTADPATPVAARYLEEQEVRLKNGLTLKQDGQPLELAATSRQLMFAEGAGGLPTMKLAFLFRGRIGAGEHSVFYTDNNFPGRSGWKEVVVVGNGAAILQSSAPATDRSQQLTNYSTDLLNSPPQQLSAVVEFRTDFSDADIPSANADMHPPVAPVRKHAQSRPAELHDNAATAVASVASNPSKQSANSDERENNFPSGSGAASVTQHPVIRSQNTPRSHFTELISTQGKLGFWVLLSAAFIAAGLGALHALEPGHGKTIVAAYLVGSRGTARHAVLLGMVVTASHTAGVYLLGIVTLYASRYIVPDQLYPWLGAISGWSVMVLGVFIFLRHLTGESGEHSHVSGEKHSHWFFSIFKRVKVEEVDQREAGQTSSIGDEHRGVSLRELCLLGITGGIVPCPAALVVLLSAFSLHRIGFGLFLITAFSLGLAVVLVIVGLTMVYTKRFMAPRIGWKITIARHLPLLSSAFMVVLGTGIAISALSAAPIGQSLFSKDKLVPFVTVTLLGLFLGMRHSTDPDHVVAVSTIVSRQKSIRSSAVVGLLWGLGHTLTIFFVGSAIIIFGVVIPPRLGLSMEFCVALMLILLGVLNLTGALRWITERFTPAQAISEVQDSFARDGDARSESALACIRPSFLDNAVNRLGLFQTLRPLVVGLVHGLAGSAAVALLVLSTIKNPFWSTVYLIVFGVGTMAGMMLMTTAISAPLVYAGQKFFSVNRHLTTVSGLASVAFGMFLVYHIGFVDGLFTAHVHWIPQ